MKKQSNRIVKQACVFVGFFLIVIAVLLPFLWQWGVNSSVQKMEDCVRAIRDLIPEPQSAVPEERRDNTMSVLSLDGTDYVGILEIPRYESTLPVCADWGAHLQLSFPYCKFYLVYHRWRLYICHCQRLLPCKICLTC